MFWNSWKSSKIWKLYVQEHMWFLITTFIICPLLGGLLTYLDRNWNYLYLVILYLSVSLTGFLIHYRRSYGLYQLLTEELLSAEDLFVEGRSALSKAQRSYLEQVQHLYYRDLEQLQDSKKNYQLLISQWVHQMKTPVSVIRMLSENHPGEPEFLKVQAETKRLEYNLSQILNMVRMEKVGKDFQISKTTLSELVKSTVNEEKNYFIEKMIYPKVAVDSELMVYTDRKWFCFALGQIVNNAVKYSPQGSHVWFEARQEGKRTVLAVRDEGCGILPEETVRIFHLFYTGTNGRKKSSESTGLGLYLTKTVLDYLEHEIKVISVPDEGTIFEIWFGST